MKDERKRGRRGRSLEGRQKRRKGAEVERHGSLSLNLSSLGNAQRACRRGGRGGEER